MGASIQATAANAIIFAEGVRLPVLSWSATGGVNGAASASISIVPSRAATRLLPGTAIQIFATDPMRSTTADQVLTSTSGGGGIGNLEQRIEFEEHRGLALIFDGKMIGRGYQFHAGARRSVQLHCKSRTIDWEQTKQYWADLSSASGTMLTQLIRNNFSGVEMHFESGLGIRSFVMAGLERGASEVPSVKLKETDREALALEKQSNFLEHIVNIVEMFSNSCAYYSTERNRWRLTDRIGAVASGDDLQHLFAVETFAGFFKGQLQKLSGESTVAALLTVLLNAMHHDWVDYLAPSVVERFPVDRKANGVAEVDEDTKIFKRSNVSEMVVGSVLVKPQIYAVAPPSCNVIFPDLQGEFSYVRSFPSEPTRQEAHPTVPFFNGKEFMGIQKLSPSILQAFADNNISGKSMGTDKTTGASTSDGEQPEGDTSRYGTWHFLLDEEKFSGVVSSFLGTVPLVGTLHEKAEDSDDKTDSDDYTDKILRAQWLKSRYQSRTYTLAGPLNLRVVPGFPVLILDDSDAAIHIVGYLAAVTHSQSLAGNQGTSYQIAFPRELIEENLNAPVREAPGAAAAPGNPDEETTLYKVQSGDTLNAIGEQFGMTPKEIADANPQLLGRVYLRGNIRIDSGFDPARDKDVLLRDFNLIYPGDTVLVIPHRTTADADSHAVNTNTTRHPLSKETSRYGVEETRFQSIAEPEMPEWFAEAWRGDPQMPGSLSAAYRELLGPPVVACTHPSATAAGEWSATESPITLPAAADSLVEKLSAASGSGGDISYRMEFIDRYTRRRLVTVAEFFSFVGASSDDGEVYEGGAFQGFTDNFPFEKESWETLLKKAEEIKKKADGDASYANDPDNKTTVRVSREILADVKDGTLAYPMTFDEIYTARRERALNYAAELRIKGAFRG